jgi:hypothetical protein
MIRLDSPWVAAAVSFLLAILGSSVCCTPAATPSADPKGPTVAGVCAHQAEVFAHDAPADAWPPGSTEASYRRACETHWSPYREEGARWDCQASCRLAATTSSALSRCDGECALPVATLSCDDVFVTAEIGEAFGAAVRDDGGSFREVTQAHPSCSGIASLAGSNALVLYDLHVDPTYAEASHDVRSRTGACSVAVQAGRVVVHAEMKAPCDGKALAHAVERARAHVDASTGGLRRP